MSNKRIEIHRTVFLYCSIGLAFFMAVSQRILPTIIVVMTLNWLVEGRFIRNFPLIFKEKRRMLIFSLALLYILYLTGMLWSENFHYGWFDLEVKFSLFLFPLLFSTSDAADMNRHAIVKIQFAYVAGCFFGMLILLLNAGYRYFLFHHTDVFFYTGLASTFHAGYLGMYLSFAVAVLAYFLVAGDHSHSRRVWVWVSLLIGFFIFMIFLLSSKAGIISLGLVFGMTAAYVAGIRRKFIPGIVILVTGGVLFFGLFILLPVTTERFSNIRYVAKPGMKSEGIRRNESNSERVMAWKASFRVIRKNILFGTGTGDVKDALIEQYQKDNSTPAYTQKLNAHNQYLQTFSTLGLVGFLLLLCLILQSFRMALMTKEYLYFAFLVIFSFNLLVESMFEQQAGVIFFAFFNTLFYQYQKDESES